MHFTPSNTLDHWLNHKMTDTMNQTRAMATITPKLLKQQSQQQTGLMCRELLKHSIHL